MSVTTFALSYTKDAVVVQRGQQMSIQRAVSNIGVFRKWVNVLTLSLRLPVKLGPFVLLFLIAMHEVQTVLWFDDFYPRNLRPVPGNENRALKCTIVNFLMLDRQVYELVGICCARG